MEYQHLLAPRGDGFAIVHVESNYHVGYIYPRGTKYRVQNDDSDDIAIVSSIDKAIPVLLTFYEKHPPRWQRCFSATQGAQLFGLEVELSQLASPFGLLDVEQSQLGWLAYRHARSECRCPLLRDGKPAIFATCEEAQQAAEAHLCDGLPEVSPNAPGGELVYCTVPADGLSWAARFEAVE
jgi:hypothetical protein